LKRHYPAIILFAILFIMMPGVVNKGFAQYAQIKNYLADDKLLPESSKPWVFWYWMHASFSKEGITADLEAMKEAGIAGAYIAPIKDKTNPPLFTPVIQTLTPEWWSIFKFSLEEADRLGIKIALLPNDGFATAGGPWITPDLSMQKVVYTSTAAKGGKLFKDTLQRPEAYQGYYKDIAILAFPTPGKTTISTELVIPKVTSSTGADASFLAKKGNKQNFSSAETCWIQYEFDQPFLCRSVKINVNGFNFQSSRLIIEVSNDGKNFKSLGRLTPPRAGWLDWDAPVTHGIVPTTAKYFRFVYDPEGTEPGAEDIDAAKWKQSLKIAGITLSSAPKINQYEGKSGMVWRVGERATPQQLPDDLCIPQDKIINITHHLDANGKLNWKVPAGEWTILRIGHTSTGHKNETAGAGKGLEVDKFNTEAIKMQFDKWFGEALRVAGPDLASRVIKIFHVDSWECGSQNWSPVFAEEFKKRRGYDLTNFLPAMAGFPVQSAATSEQFLYDVRQTIAELMNDNFFETLKNLAHEKGAIFTAETTAPVMVGDGMKHFGTVDVPMGEFWLKSPSHDKPNDMLDAISGAHIYGKNVVQAEAFTTVRMEWDEHPGNIKTLQDRNYTLGINKLVYHVFTHNPWMDRKPGMTLDGVGLYFQRDQTWWKPGKAWVTYASRSQALLQEGKPVVDIAVFAGEEIPTRAILPERLVSTLPGIFGKEVVEQEKIRLANKGNPTQKVAGVTTVKNMAHPENWVNPLKGYAYDSFNADVIKTATVVNGKVMFAGGASYSLLVLPQQHQLNPNQIITDETINKLIDLVKSGANIIIGDKPVFNAGLYIDPKSESLRTELWGGNFREKSMESGKYLVKTLGKGQVVKGPFAPSDFNSLDLEKDFIAQEASGAYAKDIAWTHRKTADADIYFIANQQGTERNINISLRTSGKLPEFYDAVTGDLLAAGDFRFENGRTLFPLNLAPNASVFVLLGAEANQATAKGANSIKTKEVLTLQKPWALNFDEAFGGPKETVVFNTLEDWTSNNNDAIKHYSGTVKYSTTFKHKPAKNKQLWMELGEVGNMASVKVNGVDCGVAWTYPYRVNITKALKKGNNKLEIEVTNTWANRLIGDQALPEEKRVTKTTAPFRLQDKGLSKAGLLGPVKVLEEVK
jgi:hypothetical protein